MRLFELEAIPRMLLRRLWRIVTEKKERGLLPSKVVFHRV